MPFAAPSTSSETATLVKGTPTRYPALLRVYSDKAITTVVSLGHPLTPRLDSTTNSSANRTTVGKLSPVNLGKRSYITASILYACLQWTGRSLLRTTRCSFQKSWVLQRTGRSDHFLGMRIWTRGRGSKVGDDGPSHQFLYDGEAYRILSRGSCAEGDDKPNLSVALCFIGWARNICRFSFPEV